MTEAVASPGRVSGALPPFSRSISVLLVSLILLAPLRAYVIISLGGANLSWFRMALLILMVALSAQALVGARGVLWGSQLHAIVILVLWFLISLVGSAVFGAVTVGDAVSRFLVKFAGFAAVLVLSVAIGTGASLRSAVYAYVASAALPLLGALWQLRNFLATGKFAVLPFSNADPNSTTALGTLYGDLPRLTSTFLEPNYMGMFFGAVAIIGLANIGSVGRPGSIRNMLLATAIAATMFGLTLSLSLSAAIGFIVGVVALAIVVRVRLSLVFAGIAGAGAAVLLGSLVLASLGADWDLMGMVTARVQGRVGSSSGVFFGRDVFFLAAWDGFRDNPLFGAGIGGMVDRNGQLVLTGHNAFLTVLGEQGLMGFVPLMALLGYLGAGLWRAARGLLVRGLTGEGRMVAGLFAALVSLLVANLGYDAMFSFDSGWTLMGVCAAALIVVHRADGIGAGLN